MGQCPQCPSSGLPCLPPCLLQARHSTKDTRTQSSSLGTFRGEAGREGVAITGSSVVKNMAGVGVHTRAAMGGLSVKGCLGRGRCWAKCMHMQMP